MFREQTLSLLLGKVVLSRYLISLTQGGNVGIFLINIVKAIIELSILLLNLILFPLILQHFDYLDLFFFIFQKANRETLLIQREVLAIIVGRNFMGASLTYHVHRSLAAVSELSSLRSFDLKTELLHIIVVSNAVLSPQMSHFTCTFNPLKSIGMRRQLLKRLKFITSEVGCT